MLLIDGGTTWNLNVRSSELPVWREIRPVHGLNVRKIALSEMVVMNLIFDVFAGPRLITALY